MSNKDHFRRDFETVEEYWARLASEDQAEPQMFETDIGKVLDEPPSPLVVDRGMHTSRADNDAIQAEQDRWTRWERMGR